MTLRRIGPALVEAVASPGEVMLVVNGIGYGPEVFC